jgi:hypothetical protein
MKKNRQSSKLLYLLLSVPLFTTIFHLEVSAIPAFARKYKTSCTTCHTVITQRNSYGEAFRRNGYILPEQNTRLIKEQPLSLGAEAWKEVWPDAVWPGDIPSSFPISALSNMRFNYNIPESMKGKQAQFNFPQIFQLVFGGTFDESIGFFGEWIAYIEGSNTPSLGRLFLQFNSIIGPKRLFNIKIGRFEPGITDGYTSNQRLTLEYPVTQGNYASTDWRPRNSQSGIELNGVLNHRIHYALGVVNGDSKTVESNSDRKDIFGRVAYKFGGMGFDGKFLDNDSSQSDPSRDDSFILGLYGYLGDAQKTTTTGNLYTNNFNRMGIDAQLKFKDGALLGGLILGNDEKPFNDNRELKSISYFIESNYFFYPWLIGNLRLERIHSTINGDDEDKDIYIIPNLSILYRLNVRFSIEGMINIESDRTVQGNVISANNKNAFQWIKLNLLFVF